MPAPLTIAEFDVEVVRKDIKNLHLSVYPPGGAVRISAPRGMPVEQITQYAIARLSWIRRQQTRLSAQEREPPREYLERESHWVWGQRYLLELRDGDHAPQLEINPQRMTLTMRAGATAAGRADVLSAWYRQQIYQAIPKLLATWQPRLKVTGGRISVRKMRTKWGSCTPATAAIRLNTDLAKKDPKCLEYVLVHELTHLIEPTHNQRFVACMNQHLPQWPQRRELLNQLPVRHEDWSY